MMIIPQRSLDWVERGHRHGLSLGKHDGLGNLLLEHEKGDAVAADMVSEIQADDILRHGVGILVIGMLRRENAEDGRSDEARP